MRWSDLKVRTKLTFLIVMGSVALTAVAALGIYGMQVASDGTADSNQSLNHVARMDKLKQGFLMVRLDLVYMMLLTDPAKVEEKYADMTTRVKAVREGIKEVPTSQLDEKEKEMIKAFTDGFEAYLVQGEKLAALSRTAAATGQLDRAEITSFATSSVAPLYTKPAEAVANLVEYNITEAATEYQEDMAHAKKLKLVMICTTLAFLVGSILVGGLIVASIGRPLNRILDVLTNISSGDLSVRASITSKDEMGQLATVVNQMTEKLQDVMRRVAGNTNEVAAASIQLHATSKSMAIGTEEVACQVATVSTSGEEMAATSHDIANNCNAAADNSRHASDLAMNGSVIVRQTVEGMQRISGLVKETAQQVEGLGVRSEEIGAIVGTIEDIADQTNLLALNAAIEAARAGEQGRGFAVVADEVRALAERTTRATKEIAGMIRAIQSETRLAVASMEEGVHEVETGTTEAARSGSALQQILDQINEVTGQINQIATAAEEQSCTSREISNNVHQITDIIQETAKSTQETTEAANILSRLATDLEEMVSQFKL